ncbi:MAG: aminoglycoside phosphotransferase family protein [Ilumatobacteraceae bacterium]
MTDLDGAWRAARAAAVRWELPEPVLMRSGMNVIFESGRHVLRVGEPTTTAVASLDLAGCLRQWGIRVPAPARDDVVTVDGMSVTAWERLLPENAPIDWVEVGAMVRRVHDIQRTSLPASVPIPLPDHFGWWNFDDLLSRVDGALDAPARAGIDRAISLHDGWQATTDRVVCHGDVHPGNVVMTVDGPFLIDWDLLCWAPAGWDHAPMLTWATRWGGAGHEYADFAIGYGTSMTSDPVGVAIAELRLVAATLMRLAAGLRDPAAMPEAQRRLEYWRGAPDPAVWRAQ